MAKKIEDTLAGLKKEIQAGKVVIGQKAVMKALGKASITQVYLASNCAEQARVDLEHYAKLADVEIINLKQTNEELGVFCKKNFFVSVIGILGA
jgi:ribosomal protein L30E